jgi:polyhydroxyalkanoate synthase
MHDPIVALRKFRRFAALPPESAEARAFVALEDWLNDGVPITLPVADEVTAAWYRDNATGRGRWRLDGAAVDPTELAIPVLVAVPGRDRIVTPDSAAAIIPHLAQPTRLDVPLGHIGMVVGRGASRAVWQPLARWLQHSGNAA